MEDSINENPKVNNLKTVSDGLNNAGGLQFMISTNQQILGRLLKQNFEIPLQAELNKLQSSYQENHQFYQQEIRLRSRILRDKELKNLKLSKLKTRNLSEYKNNLVELTRQVEEIDRLKYGYYHEINLMLERFNQDHLLTRTGSLVRAQLEIYEGIAKKGWSGGGLDELLAVSPDLFAHNEDEYSKENQADGGEFDNEDTLDFINRLDNVETEGIEGLDDEDEDDEVVVSGAFDLNKNEVLEDETVLWRGGDERVKIPLIGGRSTPIQSQQTEELNDISVDESFSLPMVSNSNSLLGKGKDKQEEGGELEGTHAGEGEKGDADTINKDNLLSDL